MPNTPASRVTRSNSAPGLTLQDIKSLVESSENRIIATLKGEIDELKATVTSMRLEISNLESQQRQLEIKYEEVNGELTMLRRNQSQAQIDLSNELDERLRRNHNFIISGIPETESTSSDNSYDDKEKCFDVLRQIGIGREIDSVIEVSRIGRPDRERPRLLKVKCDSVATKDSVMINAKKLRGVPKFRQVYINPDRTPMQQRLWKGLRNELRNRRLQGEDAVIFRNQVIRRREAKNF